jgi:membrane protein
LLSLIKGVWGIFMISKIRHFLNIGIWEIRLTEINPFKAFVIRWLRVFLFASRQFYQDKCPERASALTYYSLLSIVPVIGLVFGIAKGFGLEKIIQNQILQFAQRGGWQVEIVNRILNFSSSLLEQTRGGLIAGVGVIFLFWTLISILGNIEGSFNDIWEVRRSRTYMRKFTDYLAIAVFTPILVIISSSFTVVAASQAKLIVQKIALLGAISPVIFFLLNLLPYVSIWFLLILNYMVLPNTRVPLRAGIFAGIAAGTIYQIVQWIYIKFQIGVASYGYIYGSFAALPLFLVWLQISWMIVLFGAEIAFAYEHVETFGFHPDHSRISMSSKKVLMLKIFHLLVKRFSQGEAPLSARQIAHALEIPVRLVRQLLNELAGVGLVIETTKGKEHEVTFQPAKAIENITVKHTLDAIERHGDTFLPVTQSTTEGEKLSDHLRSIAEAVEKAPGNVVLKDV